jgi:hypothetical protein
MSAAKKTTARRTARKSVKSAASARIDLDAARAFAAARLPGTTVNGKFGGVSFFIGGKVFAFSRPKGLVLKLPPEAMEKALATREAQPLVMGKRVMRDWALLALASRESYTEELPLLKTAMKFVASLAKV